MEQPEKYFMTSDPSPFTISEQAVAQRTGLALDEVRDHRTEGWCIPGPRGRWLWSESGVVALELGLSEKNGALPEPQPISDVETFTVARVRTERVLHVVRPGDTYNPAAPLHVWLPRPRGRMFLPGMSVAAKKRAHDATVFDYEGNPAALSAGRKFPRRVGVW